MRVFYNDKNYKIVERITKSRNPDPIDWEVNSIAKLCNLLISEADEEIKKQFFTKPLYDKLRNVDPDSSSLPILFIDPYCSKGASKFNPSTISRSGICVLVKHYANDKEGSYREFVKKLTEKDVLLKDELRMIKCPSCKSITFGKGEKCSCCGKAKEKIYHLYHFSEIIVPILYQPGKILEGIVFHCLKKQLEDKGYSIFPNLYLESKKKGEESPLFDLDTVVIDNRKPGILVILSSIDPGNKREQKQVKTLKKFGIPTLFITTGSFYKTKNLAKISKHIISEIHKIKNIKEEISKRTQSFFRS